jgi:exopolyphosphatase/guanosine-5'-triphosphate,3'-diphosphate pyrophosphatase
MTAAIEILARMKAIADGFGAKVRAVATSAVRDAVNGRDFRETVRRKLGLRLDVISGREEGLLAFRSAARHFDFDSRRVAVADIGGGSLEVVLATGTAVEEVHTFPLGTVYLTEQFLKSDPLRPRHAKALRKEIDTTLGKHLASRNGRPDVLIGSGGTFTALAQIARAHRGEAVGSLQGYTLSADEVTSLAALLRKLPLAARSCLAGLNPRRADIVVAGAAVVARLVKKLGVRRVAINERGLRDGILLSMIDGGPLRVRPGGKSELGARLRWARDWARKYRSNIEHCEQVARLADKIFLALQSGYDLPLPSREVLHAAALLHDVGYLLSHERHNQHAYHLILHSALPGFTAREVELIANVARYQCGPAPKKSHPNFAQLVTEDRRQVRKLSAILRLADALDRTRSRRAADVSLKLTTRTRASLRRGRLSPRGGAGGMPPAPPPLRESFRPPARGALEAAPGEDAGSSSAGIVLAFRCGRGAAEPGASSPRDGAPHPAWEHADWHSAPETCPGKALKLSPLYLDSRPETSS